MDRRTRLRNIATHLAAAECSDDFLPAPTPAKEHHDGVDAPGKHAKESGRSADDAARHNLGLADHPNTPLMNTPFNWAQHGSPRRDALRVVTPEQAAQFDRDGFCLVEGAFRGQELASLVAEIDALEAKLASDGGISKKDEITFCAHLCLRSERCRAFTSHPIFADLCHDLLNTDDARLYWDQSVYKKPAAPERIFPYHQDNGYTFTEPQPYLTCWVALNDATPQNGCPNLIPGVARLGARHHDYDTHHNGWAVTDLATENSVCVPASAGSIVVFSSLAPHMTSANTTDGVRKAYICQYARDGVVAVGSEDGTKATRTATPSSDPDRQYFVLKDGQHVPPPPLPEQL